MLVVFNILPRGSGVWGHSWWLLTLLHWLLFNVVIWIFYCWLKYFVEIHLLLCVMYYPLINFCSAGDLRRSMIWLVSFSRFNLLSILNRRKRLLYINYEKWDCKIVFLPNFMLIYKNIVGLFYSIFSTRT